MKLRAYDSSNNFVKEVSVANVYSSTYGRTVTPSVPTAGTYTFKLVNADGVEGTGATYIYY